MARRSYGSLLKRNRFGDADAAATNAALVTFLSNNLSRRGRFNTDIQKQVNEAYPMAALTSSEVDASWRALTRPYYDKTQELTDLRKEMARYTGAVPPRRVPASLLAREQTILEQRADLGVYLNQFQSDLRRAEQAEQVSYAILDENPLIWVLLDFWFNHFNVSSEKVVVDLIGYRERINARMFGKFSDLLLAVAHSPGMGIYLDNASNRTLFVKDAAAPGGYRITRAPNENYAREVMELHTLGQGPSSGSNATTAYNQNDVRQAALLLSGWNLTGMDPRLVGPRRFLYIDSNNVPIPKVVMTRQFSKGYVGGVDFLRFLGDHPLTAANITKKLVRRFVTENTASGEYQALTERLKNLFLQKDGDLLALYRALIGSREFWSREAFRNKVKQPLQLVASAQRASGVAIATTDLTRISTAMNQVHRMGQRLTMCTPPTGYPDSNQFWMSTNNALATVQYGFQSATYSGVAASPLGRYYTDYEAYAASLLAPAVMGPRGKSGMEAVFGFADLGIRFQYPDSVTRAGGILESIAGNKPDRSAGKPLPVRTVLGLVTGSADFIRN